MSVWTCKFIVRFLLFIFYLLFYTHNYWLISTSWCTSYLDNLPHDPDVLPCLDSLGLSAVPTVSILPRAGPRLCLVVRASLQMEQSFGRPSLGCLPSPEATCTHHLACWHPYKQHHHLYAGRWFSVPGHGKVHFIWCLVLELLHLDLKIQYVYNLAIYWVRISGRKDS